MHNPLHQVVAAISYGCPSTFWKPSSYFLFCICGRKERRKEAVRLPDAKRGRIWSTKRGRSWEVCKRVRKKKKEWWWLKRGAAAKVCLLIILPPGWKEERIFFLLLPAQFLSKIGGGGGGGGSGSGSGGGKQDLGRASPFLNVLKIQRTCLHFEKAVKKWKEEGGIVSLSLSLSLFQVWKLLRGPPNRREGRKEGERRDSISNNVTSHQTPKRRGD